MRWPRPGGAMPATLALMLAGCAIETPRATTAAETATPMPAATLALAAHGWEYGFVMSYPAGSEDETCFSYEPWHYRWIGREAAAEQHASGVDLRRFLERYVRP